MEKLKSIVGFNCTENNGTYKSSFLEGDIIVKDDNSFEGIVSNRLEDKDKDYVIKGTISQSRLEFEFGEYFYNSLKDGNKYVGNLESNDDELTYVVNIRDKKIDKFIEQAEMASLKEIINIHKNMSENTRQLLCDINEDLEKEKQAQKVYPN